MVPSSFTGFAKLKKIQKIPQKIEFCKKKQKKQGLSCVVVVHKTCDLCGRQGHTLERCFKLTRAPVGERQNTLKRVGACFRCLSTAKGHVYRNCDAKCTKCQGRHHALLCGPKRSSVPNCDNVTSTSPNTVMPLSSPCVSHVSGNVSKLPIGIKTY